MQKGYTLIELLIAISITAIISVVSVNLLWDTVSSRSKEYSIERSSDNFRQFIHMLTNAIQESKAVNIPANGVVEITGSPCRTISYNSAGLFIEGATDNAANCTPPTGGYQSLTDFNIDINRFDTQPVTAYPSEVNITIEGVFKDSLGEHPFSYQTTVYPRVSI